MLESPALLTIGVSALVGLLLLIALSAQSVQRKKEQKTRLAAALKSRVRKINNMLDFCPEGFFSKKLYELLLNDLIEANQQLSNLEKDNRAYLRTIKLLQEDLQKNKNQKTPSLRLTELKQINVLEQNLKQLEQYLKVIIGNGRVSPSDAKTFGNEIKLKKLELAYSFNEINGNMEIAKGRENYALLYFEKAMKIYSTYNGVQKDEQKVLKLQQQVENLRKKAEEQKKIALEKEAEEQAANDGEDLWKKKNIYD